MFNPKLEQSGLIDAVPQNGSCPLRCNACFFNLTWYTKHKPILPNARMVNKLGLICRVNSGHDSNLQREMVVAKTAKYHRKFYNTSIANFNFPAPVVFTCNPDENSYAALAPITPNLMAVRIRTHPGMLRYVYEAIGHYAYSVPIILTWMRYSAESAIPRGQRQHYERSVHVINPWWQLIPDSKREIMAQLRQANPDIYQCGTYESSLCRECLNCVRFYWRAMRRMEESK